MEAPLFNFHYPTLRDGNYLIFKDAPKIETIKAGLKYIDINVLRRFSVILHCNGISSHFNIRRSLSSDSYINKSTAKHFTNETFVYLLVRICLYPRVHENTSKSNLNPSGFFYFRLHTFIYIYLLYYIFTQVLYTKHQATCHQILLSS